MKRTRTGIIAGSLLVGLSAFGLELEVQRFDNSGSVPAGYQDVSGGIDSGAVVNLSADPFVDYIIPNNSGSAGLTAVKFGGEYVAETTVADMGGNNGGANNLTGTDRFQVVFQWDDGDPLPFGEDYYGVSWSNWSADSTATLTTRINLASDQEVMVYHWFNDGWNYADGGHSTLSGHNLTVTHYDAGGGVVAEESVVLPSGGAEDIFGDHRQFYSAIIKATRTGEGDYLVITNLGGNIGYKGTGVALLGDAEPTMGPGEFSDYELVDGWVNSGDFMGWVYVGDYPWVRPLALDKYIFASGSGWYYIAK